MIVLTYMLLGHYQTILKLYPEETLACPALSSGAVVQIFMRGREKVRNAQDAVMKPTWVCPNLCPSAVKILPGSTCGTIEDMARLVTSLAGLYHKLSMDSKPKAETE